MQKLRRRRRCRRRAWFGRRLLQRTMSPLLIAVDASHVRGLQKWVTGEPFNYVDPFWDTAPVEDVQQERNVVELVDE